MEPRLHLDAASLRAGSAGPATGEIWLEFDGQAFPASGWTDFVVVVLGWCVAALVDACREPGVSTKVCFMEGPYAVNLFVDGSGMLSLRAIERSVTGRERVVAEGHLPAAAFGRQLSHGVGELLASCRRMGLWSEDEARLERAVTTLLEHLRGLGG